MKPSKIDSSFYVILPWVLEGLFFLINSLQSTPFLFTELPTPDALWERLRKIIKGLWERSQSKTSPLNSRGFILLNIFFLFYIKNIHIEKSRDL